MTLIELLRRADLTGAERRVADVMAKDPNTAAFGTVAEIAAQAGTGGATVMRLASKIGFHGFRELQDAARDELTRQLRPAAARARLDLVGSDPRDRSLAVEIANLQTSLGAIEPRTLRGAAALLLKAERVAVVASDATSGVAADFVSQLSMVRADVAHATGATAALVRSLAWLGKRDVLVALDIARYEAAVLEVVRHASSNGAPVIAVTDSPLARIAQTAVHTFTVSCEGPGPFDSLVAMLAVTNLLVASAVARRGEAATEHLDRLESTWTELRTLTDD